MFLLHSLKRKSQRIFSDVKADEMAVYFFFLFKEIWIYCSKISGQPECLSAECLNHVNLIMYERSFWILSSIDVHMYYCQVLLCEKFVVCREYVSHWDSSRSLENKMKDVMHTESGIDGIDIGWMTSTSILHWFHYVHFCCFIYAHWTWMQRLHMHGACQKQYVQFILVCLTLEVQFLFFFFQKHFP